MTCDLCFVPALKSLNVPEVSVVAEQAVDPDWSRKGELMNQYVVRYNVLLNQFLSFQKCPAATYRACSLRTFVRKSSHIEICFISGWKLGHKLLIPKMKKKWGGGGGHRLCFGEKAKGKMP